jgi:5-methylcytosine-specific restriction endonuclease McrA
MRTKRLILDNYRCQMCRCSIRGKGKAIVDHIQTRRDAPQLELDINNLRSLCRSCDGKRHGAEKSAGQRAKLGSKSHKTYGCDAQGNPLDPKHPWS